MLSKQNIEEILQDKVISKEKIDLAFDNFENQLLDMGEVVINMKKITFIAADFLERLEQLVEKAKEVNVQVKITNVKPEIYKVFQVARVINILNICS